MENSLGRFKKDILCIFEFIYKGQVDIYLFSDYIAEFIEEKKKINSQDWEMELYIFIRLLYENLNDEEKDFFKLLKKLNNVFDGDRLIDEIIMMLDDNIDV